jgi:hypothetical protein
MSLALTHLLRTAVSLTLLFASITLNTATDGVPRPDPKGNVGSRWVDRALAAVRRGEAPNHTSTPARRGPTPRRRRRCTTPSTGSTP